MHWWAMTLLLALAFLLNVPLGAWRGRQKKFSPAWFVGIHASIPVLFIVRAQLDVTHWAIPLEAVLLLAGQTVGNRWGGTLFPAWRRTADARVKADT
jgi:hypothetical protein